MRFHADLHVHSKYSRATSRDLDLEHLAAWAARKGITVVATGDFTHPAWRTELKEKLVAAEPGLFRLRPEIERAVAEELPPACRTPVRFMLEVEISTIYKKSDKTRKVHHLIYAPDFATADRISERLARIGNIASDGRPILGLDSRDLLEITLTSSPDAYLIPAHIWTPWFAALGSQSGFDSIAACYGDLADHIFAVETGLSSDPPMNWRLSMLDRYRLVSNSDAHSPGKLGREATTFDCALDYFALRKALETWRRLRRHRRILSRGGQISSRRPPQMRREIFPARDAGPGRALPGVRRRHDGRRPQPRRGARRPQRSRSGAAGDGRRGVEPRRLAGNARRDRRQRIGEQDRRARLRPAPVSPRPRARHSAEPCRSRIFRGRILPCSPKPWRGCAPAR